MDVDLVRSKRPRELSPASSASSSNPSLSRSRATSPSSFRSPSPSASPTSSQRDKTQRQRQRHSPPPRDLTRAFECSLPPTCFPLGRLFDSAQELERHQAAFHSFVCRVPVRDKAKKQGTLTLPPKDGSPAPPRAAVLGGGELQNEGEQNETAGEDARVDDIWSLPREFTARRGVWRWRECGKIFPDQRLMDLHEIECHDAAASRRQRDGYEIFQCFITPPTCTRVFLTPRDRRHHLIKEHNYPKQYYFSITNHGLNQLTAEEGLGASLIRPSVTVASKSTNIDPAPTKVPGSTKSSSSRSRSRHLPKSAGQLTPQNAGADGDKVSSIVTGMEQEHDSTSGPEGNVIRADHKNSQAGVSDIVVDEDNDEAEDEDMDQIIGKLAKSTITNSLAFVPKQVRKKGLGTGKTGSGPGHAGVSAAG